MKSKIVGVIAVAMAVALSVAALLALPTAASAACKLNLGSVSVRSNVSCHITQVIEEKVVPHIEAGQESFRVYARGVWHCEMALIEGYHAMDCSRRRGLVIIVSE